jgi:hypothetical protein
MADAVATQTLFEGKRKVIMKFTNVSDGTGEAAVSKVTMSALTPVPISVNIQRIWYTTDGMAVRILWDATTDVLAWALPNANSDCLDFRDIGGIVDNGGSGATHAIQFTTVGHTSGDTYSIVLELTKNY